MLQEPNEYVGSWHEQHDLIAAEAGSQVVRKDSRRVEALPGTAIVDGEVYEPISGAHHYAGLGVRTTAIRGCVTHRPGIVGRGLVCEEDNRVALIACRSVLLRRRARTRFTWLTLAARLRHARSSMRLPDGLFDAVGRKFLPFGSPCLFFGSHSQFGALTGRSVCHGFAFRDTYIDTLSHSLWSFPYWLDGHA